MISLRSATIIFAVLHSSMAAAIPFVNSVTPNSLCHKDYPVSHGLICYKPCKAGYEDRGGGPGCWARCPPNTTDIGAQCTKHVYGRGIGKPLSSCGSAQEKSGLHCYPKCKSGYYGVGDVCWSYCKSGYTDNGTLCRRNAHVYARNVKGCPRKDKCCLCYGLRNNKCGSDQACRKACQSGYHASCCFYRRNADMYAKSAYNRGVGEPVGCKAHEEKDGTLCYPPCKSGYKGVGPVCRATCSSETIDTGTQCRKKSYSRGVGKAKSCLKVPTLVGVSNYEKLVGIFKKVRDFKWLQEMGCSILYKQVELWLILFQTFNNCMGEGEWSTVALQVTAEGAAFGAVEGSFGIAYDLKSRQGLCYVSYCIGFRTDVSIGVEVSVGLLKDLDTIPGKSIQYQISIDFAGSPLGVGADVVTNTHHNFVGTFIELRVGTGVMPIDVGVLKCYTPQSETIPFTA